jgi:hypothetical protein
MTRKEYEKKLMKVSFNVFSHIIENRNYNEDEKNEIAAVDAHNAPLSAEYYSPDNPDADPGRFEIPLEDMTYLGNGIYTY